MNKKSNVEVDVDRERSNSWKKARDGVSVKRVAPLRHPSAQYVDGTLMVTQTWGQVLPALCDTEYFWNVLEDLRKNLTPDAINLFAKDSKITNVDDILIFANWAVKTASDSAFARERKRDEEIEEVRRSLDIQSKKDDIEDDDDEICD